MFAPPPNTVFAPYISLCNMYLRDNVNFKISESIIAGRLKLLYSFILTIKNDPEGEKIQIILEEVRNVLLASLEDMEEMEDFLIR